MLDTRPAPIRILVADADASARDTLVRAASAADALAGIDVARTGRELFALLQRHTYDVLVLDTLLPDIEATKLLEVLTVVRRRKATRLILMADALKPSWTRLALRLHAYDVLLKPLRVGTVTRTFESCLAALRPRTLLVVDPSEKARAVVQRIVRESQFSAATTEAGTGRQAIRTMRRQSFEVALVDFGLGDMPALEVACQIMARTQEATSVVMMDGGEEARRGLGVFGIRSVLAKPFAPVALDDALHRALGLWRPYLALALDKTAVPADKPSADKPSAGEPGARAPARKRAA